MRKLKHPVLFRSAGSQDHYLHVSGTDGLHALYSSLADVVCGRTAFAGLIDEEAKAPCPFQICRFTGPLSSCVRNGRSSCSLLVACRCSMWSHCVRWTY